MEKSKLVEITNRVSWGSIIAGVVTVIAISILLSLLGTSIGLYMFNPLSADPFSGIGSTMSIWSVVSLLISLAAGSFVAGKLAGANGMIHGFIVWSMTLFMSIILIISLAMGTAKLTYNVLGSVTSTVGNLVAGAGSIVENEMSDLSEQSQNIFGKIDMNTSQNGANVQDQISKALKKSGIKELQPEYLDNQLNEVKSDFNRSLETIVKNPNNADKVLNNFTNDLEDRINKISRNIDRDELVTAVANNSDMSKAEVEKMVDNYIQLRNKAVDKAKNEISELKENISKAEQKWNEVKHEALVKAEKASNTAATSGLISFFALCVGAILSSMAGGYGVRKNDQENN